MKLRALALLCLAASPAAHASSQELFAEMLVPGGPRPLSRARYEQRRFGEADAAGQTLSLEQHRLDLSTPLASSERSSWRAQASAGYDGIGTQARFPGGRPLPNRLWNVSGGLSHSRKLENERNLGASLSVGSASERPFHRGRDLGYSLSLTYRLPGEAPESAWFLFLSASNTRGFLNHVPLPGFAYFFRAHERLRMMAGLPFVMLFWTPSDRWNVLAYYFPVSNAELRVSYGSPRSLQPYALLSHRTHNFRLSDRLDSQERLFQDEGLAQTGLVMPVARGVQADLGGGLAFGRRYFLATKVTQRNTAPGVRVANAAFGTVRLQAAF